MSIAANKPHRSIFGKKERFDEPRYIEPLTTAHEEAPLLFVIAYIACIAFGGLGDWYVLMQTFVGMYMKGASVLAVLIAALSFLRTASFRRLREIGSFAMLFSMMLIFTLLLSLIIWASNAEPLWAISRGAQKIIFQIVNIASVLSAVYLFGGKALVYYFYGIVIANLTIIGIEVARGGIARAVESMLDCYLRGNTYGFMKAIEIHDITFCMGLFCLYFLGIECKKKPISRVYALVAFLLFIAGYKRIAIFSFLACVALWFLLERLKVQTRKRVVYALSLTIVVMAFLYVLFIKSGWFQILAERFNIDTAGRGKIYAYIDQFYTVDMSYMGYGFEYTVAMLRDMKVSGTQEIAATGIHNDILKQYIELGFWGFWVWTIFIYFYQVRWYMKRYGETAARLMLMLNIYSFVTYMTDNTIYYFWLSMSMRVIMIGFANSDEVTARLNQEHHQSGLITYNDMVKFAEDEKDE